MAVCWDGGAFFATRITGAVENDTIKLSPGAHLPDGTEASIEPRTPPRAAETPLQRLEERYAELIGIH